MPSTITAIPLDSSDVDHLDRTTVYTWGEEQYSLATDDEGRPVAVIESPFGTEAYAFDDDRQARQWLADQCADSMLSADQPELGDTTFATASGGPAAGLRTDAATGTRYLITRVHGAAVIEELDDGEDAYDQAVIAAADAADQHYDATLAAVDDVIERAVWLRMCAIASEERTRALNRLLGRTVRMAKKTGRIGRAPDQTAATQLAARLGVDRSMLNKALAGDAWA